jgi:hypothetical protein
MAKNKTEQQLREEMEATKVKDFLKAFDEATKPVFKQYGLILQPIIQTNSVGGMNPAFGIGKYTVEEVTPQDPDGESPQPEAI